MFQRDSELLQSLGSYQLLSQASASSHEILPAQVSSSELLSQLLLQSPVAVETAFGFLLTARLASTQVASVGMRTCSLEWGPLQELPQGLPGHLVSDLSHGWHLQHGVIR